MRVKSGWHPDTEAAVVPQQLRCGRRHEGTAVADVSDVVRTAKQLLVCKTWTNIVHTVIFRSLVAFMHN